MPAPIELRTAWSTEPSASPPRLMLTTAGFTALAVIQSMPAMMPE